MLTTFQLITLDYWEDVYNKVYLSFNNETIESLMTLYLCVTHLPRYLSGIVGVRTYQRLVLHGGRVFWLILFDQSNARGRCAELRRGSRNNERGTR